MLAAVAEAGEHAAEQLASEAALGQDALLEAHYGLVQATIRFASTVGACCARAAKHAEQLHTASAAASAVALLWQLHSTGCRAVSVGISVAPERLLISNEPNAASLLVGLPLVAAADLARRACDTTDRAVATAALQSESLAWVQGLLGWSVARL